jgi:DNA-binding MarR family transcriptional regulator
MDVPVASPTERFADSAAPQDAVSWLLHELAVATSRYDVAVSAQLAVSATDFLALKYVLMSEEPLGPARLGQLLGMTSGAATTLVDRLERAGHLERRPHPSDRRRKVLAVTVSTHERILEELHPVASAVDEFASSFPPAELRVLRRFLTGTLRIHRSAEPSGGPLTRDRGYTED